MSSTPALRIQFAARYVSSRPPCLDFHCLRAANASQISAQGGELEGAVEKGCPHIFGNKFYIHLVFLASAPMHALP